MYILPSLPGQLESVRQCRSQYCRWSAAPGSEPEQTDARIGTLRLNGGNIDYLDFGVSQELIETRDDAQTDDGLNLVVRIISVIRDIR